MPKQLNYYLFQRAGNLIDDFVVRQKIKALLGNNPGGSIGSLSQVTSEGNSTEDQIITSGGIDMFGSTIINCTNIEFPSQNAVTGTIVTLQGPNTADSGIFFLSLPSENGILITENYLEANTSLQDVTDRGYVTTNYLESEAGFILSSPDGTRFLITVADDGSLTTNPI